MKMGMKDEMPFKMKKGKCRNCGKLCYGYQCRDCYENPRKSMTSAKSPISKLKRRGNT